MDQTFGASHVQVRVHRCRQAANLHRTLDGAPHLSPALGDRAFCFLSSALTPSSQDSLPPPLAGTERWTPTSLKIPSEETPSQNLAMRLQQLNRSSETQTPQLYQVLPPGFASAPLKASTGCCLTPISLAPRTGGDGRHKNWWRWTAHHRSFSQNWGNFAVMTVEQARLGGFVCCRFPYIKLSFVVFGALRDLRGPYSRLSPD